MKANKPLVLAALVLILLVGFGSGAAQLNADAIWTDELYSLANIGAFEPPYSLAQIIDSLAQYSPQHTPLYYFISAGWASVAGWSQVSLRVISLFAGSLFIAGLYRLCADLFGPGAGLTGACLAATSVFLLVAFHEIRMYTLMLMLTALHATCYWRLAYGRARGGGTALGFVLTAAALLYTHMFSAIMLAALGLYHLLFGLRPNRGWRIVAGWLAAGLLFLPYVPVVYAGFLEETSKPSTVSAAFAAPELLATLATLLGNGSVWICLLLCLLLLWRLWHLRCRAALRWLAFAGLMLGLLLVFNQQFRLIGLYRSRYLLILWLPFLALFAYAISAFAANKPLPHFGGGVWGRGLGYHLRKNSRSLFVVACLLLWSALGGRFQRSDDFSGYVGGMVYASRYPNLQHAVTGLRSQAQEEDFMLGFTGAEYFNSDRKHGVSPADYYTRAQLGIDGVFISERLNGERLQSALEEKLASHPFPLLVYEPYNPPENLDETRAALEVDYRACKVLVDSDWLFAQRYIDRALDCDHARRETGYESGIRLVDRFVQRDVANDRLRIVTGWEAPSEDLLTVYNVSLQIIDADGRNVAQQDRHIDAELLKWHDAELSTASLAAGEYRVVVIVYERDSMKKAAGIDVASGQTADTLPIYAFRIEG
ncbi:MAG: glycosyltransferase family 39 protein [Chloroflexi bacterium]|nr:glycosyltransferase family 39 protein [Chloroflexota bacterium]MDE2650539.1 glycosyltransferase family 39 protein [Chloroflexota bacterium]